MSDASSVKPVTPAQVIDTLAAMQYDHQREAFWSEIFDVFCKECGSRAARQCYCTRDD